MKESVNKALRFVIEVLKIEQWAENLLFLLIVRFLFSYAILLGWQGFYQH